MHSQGPISISTTNIGGPAIMEQQQHESHHHSHHHHHLDHLAAQHHEQQQHQQQQQQHQGFSPADQWGDLSPYMQATVTMADYGGGGFGYLSSAGGVTAGPQHPHHPHHHPPLPMLMVPSHPTWPSMLTNPSAGGGGFAAAHSPPIAIPPALKAAAGAAVACRTPIVPPISSQPRKTLTDEDRRRMCQYHIDHPSMKQTEIGALFGVERSTVSKVLSRKDKWLNPEDRSSASPIKKTKGKVPDIDKTLANWLRNEQHKGRHVSDAEIQEQARMYARPFREAETKINNPSWLEKFKQKHGVAGSRLTRRASETNISSSRVSSRASPDESSSGVSPVNSSQQQPQEMDFNEPPSGRAFSEHTISPTSTQGGQFTFSPDPSLGNFMAATAAGGPNFQRPRSQTFPTIDLEFMTQQADGSAPPPPPMTPPKYHNHQQHSGPNSAMDSPAHEFTTAGPFGGCSGIDTTSNTTTTTAMSPLAQPRALHHSSSASSLQNGGGASVASSPVSPSQEDARRAADTLLSFIANSGPNAFVDQTDYNAVIRLTEKLRLHQQAQQMGMLGMGVLDRIPEGDAEMGNTHSDLIKSEGTLAV